MTWGVAQLNDDDLSVSAIKKKLHEDQLLHHDSVAVRVERQHEEDEDESEAMRITDSTTSDTTKQQEHQPLALQQEVVLDSPGSAVAANTGLLLAHSFSSDDNSTLNPAARESPVCYVLIPDVLEHEAARTREEAYTHNYGKLEYLNEVRQVCSELGYDTHVFPVRMNNYRRIIKNFSLPHSDNDRDGCNPVSVQDHRDADADANDDDGMAVQFGRRSADVVFSLCDGNEFDGFPGASVAEYLEHHNYRFAGCDSSFLRTTTDKSYMKEVFRRAGVSTPPSVSIQNEWDPELHPRLLSEMHFPLLVKLGDSYGSIGLTEKSIVYDLNQAEQHIKRMLSENFQLLVVEEFIKGPEFTVLVVGDSDSHENPQSRIHVYAPAERVFDASLGPMQRWLSYELVWVELGKRYNYAAVADPHDEQALMQLARDAYISVGGNSFGRVDIRKSERTGQFYVLEVNASCGIGYDSSSDCILRLHGHSTLEFLDRVLSSARRLSKNANA